ncbi:hypothetical protein KEM48_003899 [Puccinia striiformis f. sp. tritici PST-130]|nr:hypothetical protein KEM48_003899 [Puccinia striiformis f. sp. tritici PST-130]
MSAFAKDILEEEGEEFFSFLGKDFELSVLNIGFGLGIIDNFIQEYTPNRHLIVEPHPDVLQYMDDQGWHSKKGVVIYPGRWQDFLEDVKLGKIEANFDAIYWDTFSEDYRSLKNFFDQVFDLLSGPHPFFLVSWSGATSRTLYDIYTEMAEMDIREAGLQLTWSEVPVDGGEAVGRASNVDIGTYPHLIDFLFVLMTSKNYSHSTEIKKKELLPRRL